MGENSAEFKVDWCSRSKLRGPGERSLGELLKKLRDRLASKAQGISITYVDDRAMRKLNRQHRSINKSTDVLSFPANPEKGSYQHLGDLVISLPTAEKQAKKLGVSRRREVESLVIHGFLHLCGQDHEKDKGEMMALQAQLERELLQEEPLPLSLKRGRKTGSKVKVLKDGSRVVVTGRAAQALVRKAKAKKEKAKTSKKAEKKIRKKSNTQPKRGPGRPRKAQIKADAKETPRKAANRKRPAISRSGVIS